MSRDEFSEKTIPVSLYKNDPSLYLSMYNFNNKKVKDLNIEFERRRGNINYLIPEENYDNIDTVDLLKQIDYYHKESKKNLMQGFDVGLPKQPVKIIPDISKYFNVRPNSKDYDEGYRKNYTLDVDFNKNPIFRLEGNVVKYRDGFGGELNGNASVLGSQLIGGRLYGGFGTTRENVNGSVVNRVNAGIGGGITLGDQNNNPVSVSGPNAHVGVTGETVTRNGRDVGFYGKVGAGYSGGGAQVRFKAPPIPLGSMFPEEIQAGRAFMGMWGELLNIPSLKEAAKVYDDTMQHKFYPTIAFGVDKGKELSLAGRFGENPTTEDVGVEGSVSLPVPYIPSISIGLRSQNKAQDFNRTKPSAPKNPEDYLLFDPVPMGPEQTLRPWNQPANYSNTDKFERPVQDFVPLPPQRPQFLGNSSEQRGIPVELFNEDVLLGNSPEPEGGQTLSHRPINNGMRSDSFSKNWEPSARQGEGAQRPRSFDIIDGNVVFMDEFNNPIRSAPFRRPPGY